MSATVFDLRLSPLRASAPLRRLHLNDIVVGMGTILREGRGSIIPPPPGFTACPTTASIRAEFWGPMREIVGNLEEGYRTGISNEKLGKLLNAANALLHLAPSPRLRRLWNLSEARYASVLEPGTWIYVIWSPYSPEVYIG